MMPVYWNDNLAILLPGKKREKIRGTVSGTLQWIHIYPLNSQTKIGYGWVITSDFGMSRPSLFTNEGEPLPESDVMLLPTGDVKLVVLALTIQ
jgi:hypothetical protein